MINRAGVTRAVVGRISAGWSVLAVGLGDGWLLEIHNASGPVDFLLAPGSSVDLLAPWSDELLAAIGLRRSGPWAFASTSFGFRASLEADSVQEIPEF